MGKVIFSLIGFLVSGLIKSSFLFAFDPIFTPLQQRLIADGFSAELVQKIYQDPAVGLEPQVIAGNLKRSEKTLDYSQYLTETAISKAKNYLQKNWEPLNQAFQKFGVPPAIIVAILTVETWLGTYTGKYLTINILSTLSLANEPQVQEKIFSFYGNEITDPELQKQISSLLSLRSERGYRELKDFFSYVEKNQLDPLSIKGSVEGAIGIPQFMPSNIFQYGQDGDGDGRIDLFNHTDAIFSIAYFLHAHNWEKARDEEEKKQVLLCYNPSIYYVDTVWKLSQAIGNER
jgi:membrane-bound lytic murein transglycosylase B